MDVNLTLARLRAAMNLVIDDEMADWAADEMAEHFQALDEWLSKGGFLPGDWSR